MNSKQAGHISDSENNINEAHLVDLKSFGEK